MVGSALLTKTTEDDEKAPNETSPKQGEEYFVETSESYMVECTTCHVIYAVLGPADLNVPPKCHYCRNWNGKQEAPYRRCGCCQAKWCDPSLETSDDSGECICPMCEHHGVATVSTSVPSASACIHKLSLNELIGTNSAWVRRLGFRPKGGAIVFSGESLYRAVAGNRNPLFMEPLRDNGPTPPLSHKGKPVLNEESLLKSIQERITSSNFVGTCQLCYEDMTVERLQPSCGQCANRCCRECLSSWYGQNSPGALFVPR